MVSPVARYPRKGRRETPALYDKAVNEPGRLSPVAIPAPLDARAVRRTRVLLLVALAAPVVLLYLLSEGFRAEVNRALGVLDAET